MKLGLIGWPLGHSWSPEIHDLLIHEKYDLIPLKEEELDAFFEKRDFDGLNVTIPYKQTVMKYLDEIDEAAGEIGAVNTIVNHHGKLKGYNTDCTGLKEMIANAGIDLTRGRTAILGSGGGSKAALWAVKQLGGRPDVISRKAEKPGTVTYEEMYRNQADYTCLINTTPVGLKPYENNMPVDLNRFSNLKAAVDIIANPLRTKLLFEAKQKEIRILGGFEMLVRQAFAADELFLDTRLDPSLIDACMKELYRRRRNVVLIGMPTSGKSTVSNLLAQRTGRQLVEMDNLIEEWFGTTIAECFAEKGEDYFRAVETRVARENSEGNGKIISCGGGVVKIPETMRLLSHNGIVLWLQRDISQLYPTDSRPLSSDEAAVRKLYEERLPLYTKYADHIIDNTGDIEDTIADILALI
jgi:shikimate dehydrogenase